MPVHLSGKQVSSCFKLTTILIFISGAILNVLIPFLYFFYSLKVEIAITESREEFQAVWEENCYKIYGFKYTIGFL